MERAVYRVALAAGEVPDVHACEALRQAAAAESRAMFFAKLGAGDIEALRRLSALGFYVVDTPVTLTTNGTQLLPDVQGVTVEDARPEMAAALLAIAGSAFRYSRFHLDPCVSVDLAHRIKREWVASYLNGNRGAALLAALVDGRPAGFLAVIDQNVGGRRTRIIDLVGVAPDCQGRGVGTALTSYFVKTFARQFDLLQVGTQAANVPSIRMYLKCGFVPSSTGYVAHMHVPQAA